MAKDASGSLSNHHLLYQHDSPPHFGAAQVRKLCRACLSALILNIFASAVSAQMVAAKVLINEIDADQAGIDNAEFVELFDGGSGNMDLSGLVLVFFNGYNDAVYHAFDLDGHSTNDMGYFVLCGNDERVPNCDYEVSLTSPIQNGADAVALYKGNKADFSTSTTPTTTKPTTRLIDAIVYDTGNSDDASLLQLLMANQPQVNENGRQKKTVHSNQRCPNGSGGARKTDTYDQFQPTPGAENTCAAPKFAARNYSISGFVDKPLTPLTIEITGGAVNHYRIAPAFGNGLQFSTATATISGTPTSAFTATHIITANNVDGASSTTVNINIYPQNIGLPSGTTSTATVTIPVMITSRTIRVTVATGIAHTAGGATITEFVAAPVSTERLAKIVEMAATTSIDLSMEAGIDTTSTPTLVMETIVDIALNNNRVNSEACPARGCEVTLSYEDDDTKMGEDLYVFHYNFGRNQWEALPFVRRDLVAMTVTARATRFSPFGLFNAKTMADNIMARKQLNAAILPRLVQAMVARTADAVENRMDATFADTPQTASYRLDGQTVQLDGQYKLSASLKNTLQRKLPAYMRSLKDDTMDWQQMMRYAAFALPLNADDGGSADSALTVWGGGDYTKLSGKDWKGDVFGVQLGVDKRVRDRLVGGLVSWSKGDVDYRQRNGNNVSATGKYQHQITSFHPYMAWSGDGIKLWGSAGYGRGKLEIDQHDNSHKDTNDTRLLSVTAGVKGQLQSALSLKSDLTLVQIRIDGSDDFDPSGNRNIPTQNLASQRLRLILEAARERRLTSGALFTLVMEIGIRYDASDGDDDGNDDDGDKEAGAILGAGVRYANVAIGLTVDGKLHALLGRKNDAEWGFQGAIRQQVSADGRGLSFSLSPSYGHTGGNSNQIWHGNIADNRPDDNARLDINIGYGLSVRGGLLTPYSEITVGDTSRNYRLGIRWNPDTPFSLHLVGEHKAGSINKHSVQLENHIQF